MNKQLVNFGRRLSATEMKKAAGGIRVGTGGMMRCFQPLEPPVNPPPCDTVFNGRCCDCCPGQEGKFCRAAALNDPFCQIM